MNPQQPTDHEDSPAQVARAVVDLVRGGEPWSLEKRAAVAWRVRQGIAAMGAPRARRRTPVLLAAGAAAAVALAVVGGLWLRAPTQSHAPRSALVAARTASAEETWTQINLPDLGTLELSTLDGFEMRELTDARELRVPVGTLHAQMVRQDPGRPAVVVTPHLRVFVVGTRFDVRVFGQRTEVEVIEGKVRVETPAGASAFLTAGMRLSSDDPSLRPAPSVAVPSPVDAPAAAAPTSTERASDSRRGTPVAMRVVRRAVTPSCESLGSPDAQRGCYERLARAHDLGAQNALFTLGVLARDVDQRPDRALEYFGAYAERFPTGVLAPEAALARLELLGRQGSVEEAIAAAEDFENRFATDDRAWEVALVRARLTCADPVRRADAQAILRRVSARGPRSLAASVEQVRRECDLPGEVVAPPPVPEEVRDSPPDG